MAEMIRGIGCDMVNIRRISRLLQNNRFLEKICTQQEKAYIHDRGASSAAGIWAAKEAVSKALGTGFDGFTVRDIEILHAENGRPQVRLHMGAREIFDQSGMECIQLSITHEQDCAMAFALIQ